MEASREPLEVGAVIIVAGGDCGGPEASPGHPGRWAGIQVLAGWHSALLPTRPEHLTWTPGARGGSVDVDEKNTSLTPPMAPEI